MANNHSLRRLLQLQQLAHSHSIISNSLKQLSRTKHKLIIDKQLALSNYSLTTINKRYFTQSTSTKYRNEEKDQHQQKLRQHSQQKQQSNDQYQGTTQVSTGNEHLPKSLEVQDDLDLKLQQPLKGNNQPQAQQQQPTDSNIQQFEGSRGLAGQPDYSDDLGEKLTYSQEYYILNREELMRKRKEKEEEAKFGDFSAKLVKRPQKNFLWGFGTQVHDESKDYFTKGKLPTIREIIRFLEIYQMKDISVVNLKALGRDMVENYAIVCSGFSIKHLYNTAKLLNSEIKKLECPEIVNKPTIAGRKDDSWFMLTVKEIQVHMILHEYREDLDLEFRWLNPPPAEMVNKWKLYEKMGRRSDNIQIDEDTFKQYSYYDDSKQREFRKSKKQEHNQNANEAASDKV